MRAELGRIELWCESFVVGDGNLVGVHDPFASICLAGSAPPAGGNGIKTPVNKHAEACLAEPLHAGVALGWSFGVLNSRNGMVFSCGDVIAFQLSGGGKRHNGTKSDKCGSVLQWVKTSQWDLLMMARLRSPWDVQLCFPARLSRQNSIISNER